MTAPLPKRLVDYIALIGLNGFIPFLPQTGDNGETTESVMQTAFMPQLLLRAPRENHEDYRLSDATPLFVFPMGVKLSLEEKSPQYHYLVLTELDGTRIYCCCWTEHQKLGARNKQQLRELVMADELSSASERAAEEFYAPVSVCVVSRYPFFRLFNIVFDAFLSTQTGGLGKFGVKEVAVLSKLLNVKAPLPSARIALTLKDYTIPFSLPGKMELPLSDIDYTDLFVSLSNDSIVKVLTSLLNEKQLLFVSSDVAKLSPCIEAICSFLYPFTWAHVYIPVLALTLLDFFQAPMPFIIGVHSSYRAREEPPAGAVVVDLDSDRVDNYTGITPLPKRYHNKLVNMLNKNVKKLATTATTTATATANTTASPSPSVARGSANNNKPDAVKDSSEYLSTSFSSSDEEDEDDEDAMRKKRATFGRGGNSDWVATKLNASEALGDPKKIRMGFLSVFLSLFKKYRPFLGVNTEGEVSDDYFKLTDFMRVCSPDCEHFYKMFSGTQMFINFVQDRLTGTRDDLFDSRARAKMQRRALQMRILLSATKTGELYKQGSVMKGWKKHWFCVDDHGLCWYSNKTQSGNKKPSGSVPLTPDKVEVQLPVCVAKNQPTAFPFQIVSKENRKVLLVACAEDELIRQDWVKLLKARTTPEDQREDLIKNFKLDSSSLAKVLKAKEEPMLKAMKFASAILKEGLQRNATAKVVEPRKKKSLPFMKADAFKPEETQEQELSQEELDKLLESVV